jgi:D-lyxose ketol-isomerase
MITRKVYTEVQQKSIVLIEKAGLTFTAEEKKKIDVADFGLSNIYSEGVQILTFFETNRMAGKLLILLPDQTEPEHWHPPVENNPGKQEIVRALWGALRFYIPGVDNMKVGFIPGGKDNYYTVRQEIIMNPGDQLILEPGTKHWFQAGSEGAVFYSFSTTVHDGRDGFSDPDIVRTTRILET